MQNEARANDSLLYLMSFLDRVNVGTAKLVGECGLFLLFSYRKYMACRIASRYKQWQYTFEACPYIASVCSIR